MSITGPGCKALKKVVQQLEQKFQQVLLLQGPGFSFPPQGVEKAALSSLSPELQVMIFENLGNPYLSRDKANFIAAVPNFIYNFTRFYPVNDKSLPDIVNDLLFLFSPFNPSTDRLSLVEKIVKFRPLITVALRELTSTERIKIVHRLLAYFLLSFSAEDLHVMSKAYSKDRDEPVSGEINLNYFTNFIVNIIQVMPSINKQEGSSYFRHILVLILLSLLVFSPLEKLKKQITVISSLNLSPYLPFLLLIEYNDPSYTPLPIYTFIFNAELKGFILNKNNRSGYVMSPVRPILVNQEFINFDFSERNLSNLTFFKVNFLNVSFANANLTKATFIDCKFSKVNFNKVNLTKANLTETDLSGADFSSAILIEANLSEANLTKATFIDANLSGANLTWSNLEEANLSGANLTKTNLTWTNLSGANLTKVNLTKTDLTGTDLSRTNLSGVGLILTNLRRPALNYYI